MTDRAPAAIAASTGTRYGPRVNAKSWPDKFQSNFIEPGLISYLDTGGDLELLSKETIDRHIQSFVGKPVIVRHGAGVTPETMEAKAVGYISRVWWEPSEAWYYCEGVIFDDRAKDLIKPVTEGGKGWRVSCGYNVTSSDERGGEKNAIKYAREILGFEGEHLAIVERPRYEGATIRLNEKQLGANMENVFKILKKLIAPAATPAATAGAGLTDISGESEIEIDGNKVRLNELVELHRKNAKAPAAAPVAGESLAPDTELEVDGKSVTLANLVAGYRTNEAHCAEETARKNTADEEEEKKKKEAARKNAEDEEAKKKEAVRSNEAASRENARKGADSFRVLATARTNPPPDPAPTASFGTMDEKLARGARLCSLKPGKN